MSDKDEQKGEKSAAGGNPDATWEQKRKAFGVGLPKEPDFDPSKFFERLEEWEEENPKPRKKKKRDQARGMADRPSVSAALIAKFPTREADVAAALRAEPLSRTDRTTFTMETMRQVSCQCLHFQPPAGPPSSIPLHISLPPVRGSV